MTDTPVPQEAAAATVSVTAPAPVAAGRYSLDDAGQIFFQPDASNPLPGSAVGKIIKGDALLSPKTDYAAAQEWLDIHVRAVLEPLFLLKQEAGEGQLPEGPARTIGERLYENMGVMQRVALEDVIPQLDPDMRKALRAKGVRMGPILIFLPALVKPAAVKMRALLWGVWNGKSLPVVRPVDGRVSEVIDPATIDRDFYRMIGYPVFGPRAIRIDMLDRVITDVYDTADKGVFDAKHKYAEWLGTNLDGLHAILEAMGHRRLKETADAAGRPDEKPIPQGPDEKPGEGPAEKPVEQPAENPVPAPQPEQTPTGPAETPAPSGPEEAPMGQPGGTMAAVDAAIASVVAAAKPQPVLVKFMLKRGKMSDTGQPKQRHERPARHAKAAKKPAGPIEPQLLTEEDKARIKARQDARDEARAKGRSERKDGGSRDENRGGGDRSHKPKFDRKRERDNAQEGRIYTFESKKSGDDDDGNPFAILKKLK